MKNAFKRLRGDRNFESVALNFEQNAQNFREITLFLHSTHHPQNIPPAQGDLRLFQLAGLALLKRFTDFLNAHHLCYWLDFGTLLGAVRHGGFIPWDDDLDIAMPRADYARLKTLLPQFQKEGFGASEDAIVRVLFKDSNLNLDVFPYDFGADEHIPPLEIRQEWARIFNENLFSLALDWKNIKKIASNNMAQEDREKLRQVYVEKVLKNQSLAEKGFVFPAIECTIPPWYRPNAFFLHDEIFPLCQVQFEGFTFFAPRDCHHYLRGIYGNYAGLPKNFDTHGFWQNAPRERVNEWRELATFCDFKNLSAHEKMILGRL